MFNFFKRTKIQEEKEDRSANFGTVFGMAEDEKLTEDTIVKIPTVQSCLNLICGTIAKMPIYLYKKNDANTVQKQVVKGDRRIFLLNSEPNDMTTGYNLKYLMVKDYLIHGHSYVFIDENSTEVNSLIPVKATTVTVKKYKKSLKTTMADITVDCEGGKPIKKKNYNFIICANDSIDGLTGKGILYKGIDVLKLAKNEVDYSKSIYENGALPLGVLKAKDRLSETAINRLRNSWNNLYSGIKNSNKTIILEEGLDYAPMSLKPSDMQLDNSRGYIVSEVCRLFNIPENLINPNTKQYASVEQNNIHFLQYCIGPIVKSIEMAINKSLLLEEEKEEGYYFAFDTSELIQTTEREKMESIRIGLESGVYSLNEARAKANREMLPTDFMRFSIGQVFYDKEKSEMIIPNTNTIVNLETKEFATKEGAVNSSSPNAQQIEKNVKSEEETEPIKNKKEKDENKKGEK